MDPRLHLTPIVAIVGRTNVGKSTLFNRLVEKKKAIVSAVAGTTTDINFGHCHWQGRVMTVIDTAGLDLTSSNSAEAAIRKQAEMAMKKADVILFVCDARGGILPQDRAFASYLRKTSKPVVFVANKAETADTRRSLTASDWLKIGFDGPYPISATTGVGVGDMLDEVIKKIKAAGLADRDVPPIDVRAAIIGRPNVGKSSLLNALAGEDRVIVSELPHTTKEPQDTLIAYEEKGGATSHVLLIDTVGIRKKARVEPGIEKVGVSMSISELERADVVALIVDAESGVGVQEKKLAGLIEDKHPAMVIVVNKWDDAAEKKFGSADAYREYVRDMLPFCPWAPMLFISAKTGRNVSTLIPKILEVKRQRDRELTTEELDAFTEKARKVHHSFAHGEKRPKLYGITQTGSQPPSFMVVVKDKETLHTNYLRFLENRLRQEFGFEGTSIRVAGREIE